MSDIELTMADALSVLDRPPAFETRKGYLGHHRSGSTPTIGSQKEDEIDRGDYAEHERPALMRTLTPGYQRLTRQADTIDVPHKDIRKIACLGSGFVGGRIQTLGVFWQLVTDHYSKVQPLR